MDAQALLYVRGFLYAYGAVMTFLASLPLAPRGNGHMARTHTFQKRILALFFLVLALGGLSSFLKAPEVGQVAITYGATVLILLYDLFISYYVIFRK